MKKVLILGGYGNFGWRISRLLVKNKIPIIIAGRNHKKIDQLINNLKSEYLNSHIQGATLDIDIDLENKIKIYKPNIIINTCGPFQDKDYKIAEICIKNSINYIDLADGRDFVCNITSLNQKAKDNNILVMSGASTVPGLTSAVIEEYKNEFSTIDSLVFGIAPGQKAQRGLATTKAILSYVGKPLKPYIGSGDKDIYGWQDLYRQEYPEIGKRWMANCDIPDLDLLPKYYNIKSIKFSAGIENTFLHLGLWAISHLIKMGLNINFAKFAKPMLKISEYFDIFGSADGGMHIIINGKDQNGNLYQRKWFIIAKNSCGPYIPTIPAVIIVKKIINNELNLKGAYPCINMITLTEYLNELRDFDVKTYTS